MITSYINRKRYKKRCIQGEVNFPYNTSFICVDNGMILYNNKPICFNTSQDAYDYFVRNDDGNGLYRGKLIEEILKLTRNDAQKNKDKRQLIWDLLWSNRYIKDKFKRKDHDDVWLWNHDFYNSSIEDLEMILNTIKNC